MFCCLQKDFSLLMNVLFSLLHTLTVVVESSVCSLIFFLIFLKFSCRISKDILPERVGGKKMHFYPC